MLKSPVAVLFISFWTISLAEKLSVTLYYESLCPYCHRFVSNQLYPSYDSLKDFIQMKFVPFGNAESFEDQAGRTKFVCQHGPAECRENKIQSCSLHYLNGQSDREMQYVGCQNLNSDSVDHSGRTCAERLNIPWSNIEQCVRNGLGDRLQLEAELLSDAVPINVVPTVIFNETYNYNLWQEAIVDFPKVVCRLINNAASICQRKKYY